MNGVSFSIINFFVSLSASSLVYRRLGSPIGYDLEIKNGGAMKLEFHDRVKALFLVGNSVMIAMIIYLSMTPETGKIEGISTPSTFQFLSVILLKQSLLRSLVATKGQMTTKIIIVNHMRVKTMGSAAQKLAASDVSALFTECCSFILKNRCRLFFNLVVRLILIEIGCHLFQSLKNDDGVFFFLI